MRNLTLVIVASGALFSACDGYYVGVDPQPTGPARLGYTCGSGNTLNYDDGHTLKSWSCDSVCQGEGFDYATSCGYDATVGGDTCFCDNAAPAPAACPIAGPTCSGPYALDACDAKGVITWDCDALCQGQGFAMSEGCGYDAASREDVCLCASGPSAPTYSCLPSDIACLDGNTIQTCGLGGTPIASNCDAVCQGEGFRYSAGCGYDAGQGVDACFCQ